MATLFKNAIIHDKSSDRLLPDELKKELAELRNATERFAWNMYCKLRDKLVIDGFREWNKKEWMQSGEWKKGLKKHIQKAENSGFINDDNIDIANLLMFKNEYNYKRI